MKKICIIPARGGSKRVPRKNIRLFHGKPIISYSIVSAINSGLFDEVMVSTDDEEIAAVSRDYGAKLPFMRSPMTASDMATTYDVIEEVIKSYRARGENFEITCCLYATAPFIKPDFLNEAYQQMIDQNKDAILTITEYSNPLLRSIQFSKGIISLKWPEFKKSRSQDLEKLYYDSGQFYIYNTKKYLEGKGVFNMNTTAIIVSELEAQDIDSDIDWKIAELKYSLLLEQAKR